MQADVTTLDAKKAGTVELPDNVFGLEPRPDILARMVRYQLAKRRSGTAHVKDRSEVNYTTAKMYRQKGTGRARHGSKKAPIFRGGGKAFGPKPRSFAMARSSSSASSRRISMRDGPGSLPRACSCLRRSDRTSSPKSLHGAPAFRSHA